MLIVGLTGGIGSGKSTVTTHFNTLEVPIIDADILSHQLVFPGQPALQEIINIFGAEILTPTGSLDRTIIRQKIFSNSNNRIQLEAVLHPRIRTEIILQLQSYQLKKVPYIILSIPLLFEAKFIDLCHRIVVIDILESIQIERVQQRNRYTESEIHAIMSTQWSREQRLAEADDVIDNNGDLGYLINQINTLHYYYQSLNTTTKLHC